MHGAILHHGPPLGNVGRAPALRLLTNFPADVAKGRAMG